MIIPARCNTNIFAFLLKHESQVKIYREDEVGGSYQIAGLQRRSLLMFAERAKASKTMVFMFKNPPRSYKSSAAAAAGVTGLNFMVYRSCLPYAVG